MDFNTLQKANEAIKTTNIGKDKEYAEVNQRIKAFRMLYPEGSITTELVSLTADETGNGICIFKALVKNDMGVEIATGFAREKENSSFINKTSFIENCETSAVGRALAFCGIGIDTSVASYEEVMNAKANQEEPKPKMPEKTVYKKDEVKAYPETAKMLELAKEKYPEGSEALKKLLECWKIEKLEDAQPAHLMVIWNKYGDK